MQGKKLSSSFSTGRSHPIGRGGGSARFGTNISGRLPYWRDKQDSLPTEAQQRFLHGLRFEDGSPSRGQSAAASMVALKGAEQPHNPAISSFAIRKMPLSPVGLLYRKGPKLGHVAVSLQQPPRPVPLAWHCRPRSRCMSNSLTLLDNPNDFKSMPSLPCTFNLAEQAGHGIAVRGAAPPERHGRRRGNQAARPLQVRGEDLHSGRLVLPHLYLVRPVRDAGRGISEGLAGHTGLVTGPGQEAAAVRRNTEGGGGARRSQHNWVPPAAGSDGGVLPVYRAQRDAGDRCGAVRTRRIPLGAGTRRSFWAAGWCGCAVPRPVVRRFQPGMGIQGTRE